MQNHIVVCGTQQRAVQAQNIAYQLDASITIDHNQSPTSNHADAWNIGYQYGTEWVTVVEDDIVFGPNILPTISEILDTAPTRVVSHYLGTGVPTSVQGQIAAALDRDPAWVVSRRVLSHVALSAHRDLVPRIVEILRSSHLACDTLLSAKLREPVAYPVPSPIDHLDGETTVHHAMPGATSRPRRAWRYGDVHTPGLAVPLCQSDRWLV